MLITLLINVSWTAFYFGFYSNFYTPFATPFCMRFGSIFLFYYTLFLLQSCSLRKDTTATRRSVFGLSFKARVQCEAPRPYRSFPAFTLPGLYYPFPRSLYGYNRKSRRQCRHGGCESNPRHKFPVPVENCQFFKSDKCSDVS